MRTKMIQHIVRASDDYVVKSLGIDPNPNQDPNQMMAHNFEFFCSGKGYKRTDYYSKIEIKKLP